jgi:2-dehydro-3-deoxy-D-arabinonate dehydratase
MKVYRTSQGIYAEETGKYFLVSAESWDELMRDPDMAERIRESTKQSPAPEPDPAILLPPVVSQEVWAAGVTYFRSRSARMEESKDAGGGDFYDRVYSATRPELFFKASGRRVVSPGGKVRIRSDAKWSVPEPELALVINPEGKIIGYTIGNDMSSRDIEGENPLYLPQAKVYDGSCALGPCVLLSDGPLPKDTAITLEIERNGQQAFWGTTSLSALKRDPQELVSYLYRENSFPDGALLMTGTGIVPSDDFTLVSGDRITINIDGIGTLQNAVA